MSKKSAQESGSKPGKSGPSGFQKLALGLGLATLVGSVAARVYFAKQAPEASGGATGGGKLSLDASADGAATKGLLDGLPGFEAAEPAPAEGIEAMLPFFTEASFFGLIGFSLGYLSRKLIKVGLIFIALFFIGIQGLVQAGIVESVDWPKAIDSINAFVFNLKENQPFSAWLTDRIPTAGALTAGYLIGLKQG